MLVLFCHSLSVMIKSVECFCKFSVLVFGFLKPVVFSKQILNLGPLILDRVPELCNPDPHAFIANRTILVRFVTSRVTDSVVFDLSV